jgi:S-adenosylmethionine:tRNA ribosyltransferase-isomerase
MKLSHFQFDLPKELLAEFPSEHRDEARLMVIDRKKQTIEHKTFKDVIDYFDDGDVLILNNTKVFPRLYTEIKKNRSRIEVFYLELNAEQRLWDVLVDPARKIKWKQIVFRG